MDVFDVASTISFNSRRRDSVGSSSSSVRSFFGGGDGGSVSSNGDNFVIGDTSINGRHQLVERSDDAGEPPPPPPPPHLDRVPGATVQADNWTAEPAPPPPKEQIAKAAGKEDMTTKEMFSQLNACTFCFFPCLLFAAVVMIVLGTLKLDKCPADTNIPYFTLSYGIALLVFVVGKAVVSLLQWVCWKDGTMQPTNSKSKRVAGACIAIGSIAVSLLGVGLFAFNFIYCACVFSIWRPEFDSPSSEKYCDKTLYLWSFSYSVSTLILVGIFVAFLCCCCSIACCFVCVQMYHIRNRRRKRLIPREQLKSARSRQSGVSRSNNVVNGEFPDGGGGGGGGRDALARAKSGRTGSRTVSAAVSSRVGGDGDGDGEGGGDEWWKNTGYDADDDWRKEAARRADQRF